MPSLTATLGTLRSAPLDHRAGLLLSLMDCETDLETLLDVCAMPAQEALALITELEQQGLVRWLRPRDGGVGRGQ